MIVKCCCCVRCAPAQESGGDERLVELCKEAGLGAGELLAHDPEFDGDMPPVAEFLEKEGLQAVAEL